MRVLIVDDHPVTRDDLRSALSSSEVEIVGEATSGEEAIERVKELTPDVVFMDVRMPGITGIQATKDIHLAAPKTKVIMCTVIHPTLTRAFIEEVQFVEQRPTTPLSRRESQILQKVAYGATTKEVAHDLGISPHTVKTHLERVFEKLGANDRAHAVAIALRKKLVD
jgi:DNA-binding NarL/FixJ family response regulator